MKFDVEGIYHVYNRGNNKQTIFFREENYSYFLEKVRTNILPNCNILAWCLMPNHFHFLLHTNENSNKLINGRQIPTSKLVEGIRLTLSSYCRGINLQESRTGNLFQQKTKSKLVSGENDSYSLTAFHYIHQNPLKAGLTSRLEDWKFSSYLDYAGLRKGNLCNKQMAVNLLELNLSSFADDSYKVLTDDAIAKIF